MPPLTRWFIKTSFLYFILALLTGVLLGLQARWAWILPALNISPVYIHLLAEGWITMLIIGVVYWMFPKYTLQRPRRSDSLGWACYALLNLGLLLRTVSEPTIAGGSSTPTAWSILLATAAALQWLGGMAFVINSWGRVKEK